MTVPYNTVLNLNNVMMDLVEPKNTLFKDPQQNSFTNLIVGHVCDPRCGLGWETYLLFRVVMSSSMAMSFYEKLMQQEYMVTNCLINKTLKHEGCTLSTTSHYLT